MSRILLLVIWMACGWLSCFAERASADAAASEYEDAIRRAIEEFDAGHWEEARALFRRAHEISPNARTWRGLGITAFELRRYVDAVTELEAALANELKPLTAKQREEIEALLARARQFVSTYHITLIPGNASLIVDGQPAELREGELLLDPGSHTLLARAQGYEDRHAELRADAGQREQVSIELELERPAGAEVASEAAAPSPQPLAREVPAPRRIYTWSLLGAAGGTLAAGGMVGLFAYLKSQEYRDCDGTDAACDPIKEKGQRLQLSANVLFGVSGGLALSALMAYFLEGRAARGGRAALVPAPGGLTVTGSFRF